MSTSPSASRPQLPLWSGKTGDMADRLVRRRIYFFAIAFAVLLGGLALLVLVNARSLEIDAGKGLVESYVHVVEEQTTRTLQLTDQRLQLAEGGLSQLQAERALTEESVRQLLREQIKDLPFLRAMWVLDFEGRMIYDSDVGNTGLRLGDSAYFQIYKTKPETGFYLADPVRSRTTGKWLISAARPLKAANGTFAGVIVAAVEPPFFDNLWRSVDLGADGSIALLKRSGVLMMRSPFDDKIIGNVFLNSPLFRQYLPSNPSGTFMDKGPIDGKARQYAYRTLSAHQDLVVIVGKSVDVMLAPWRRLAALAMVIWALASTTVLLLSGYLERAWRQRMQAEAQAQLEAQRLTLATDAAGIGVWDWDLTADRAFLSTTYSTMLGYPPENGAQARERLMQRIHPDDREAVQAKVQAVLKSTSRSFEYEARIRHADGNYRWISTIGHVLAQDEFGKSTRMMGARIDITPRKLAEEKLRDSEVLYRQLFDSNPQPMWVYDLQTLGFLAVNDAAVARYGYSRDEFLGMTIRDIRPAEDVQSLEASVSSIRSVLSSAEIWRHRRKDGEVILVEITAHSLDYEGRPSRLILANDITARHLAEEKLRLSEQNLAITLQSIGDAVIATDAKGLVTRMNGAAERMTGWLISEASGRPLSDVFNIVNSQTRQPCVNPVQLVMQDGRVVGLANHTALLARDGVEYQISDSAAPIRNPDGEIVGVVLVFSDVTEAYRVRQALASTAAMLERTAEMARIGGGEIDLRTMVNHWSKETCRIHDLPIDARPSLEEALALYRPESQETLRDAIRASVSRDETFDLELQAVTPKDRSIWVRARGEPVHENGQGVRLAVAYQDITDSKAAETQLRIAASAFETQQGMFVTDAQWRILRVNRSFSEITGYSPAEAAGKTPQELLRSGYHNAEFYLAMDQSLEQTGMWQGEVWDRRKNGELFPQWISIASVTDDRGQVTHRVHAFSDITERKAAEAQIQHLAFFDSLTGLPNRRLLMDRLKQAMTNSQRRQRRAALLFVDLDNFKTLNDSLGHDKGDLLLQEVGKRLTTCIREGDTVARLGGDEFVVMLEDLSFDEKEAALRAEAIGEKVRATLNQNYLLGSYSHRSTPSIGITLFGSASESIEEPLKRADLAMYQAKAAGRNTLRFFDPRMQVAVTDRAELEDGLRLALDQNEFVLFYQGQVQGLSDGTVRLTGAEALVRWQHPQRGMVSPADFIPLAEETGMIVRLGHWVLEVACAQLAAWASQPQTAHLTMAVNVSPLQFRQDNFVPQVLDVLSRTGANPALLKLELTENVLVSSVNDVVAKMVALKAQGVGFSLDDFGTGYSSLSHLKLLPLDQLKIEQGFVRDILIDANDAAIAKMVIALGESLGLSVIAEGVETSEQRHFLASHGCHAYQGYLFSRPVPIEEFEVFAGLC